MMVENNSVAKELTEFIGIVHLERSLLCKGDVLGCTFETVIGTSQVQITFPIWETKEKSNLMDTSSLYLSKPGILRIKNEDDSWGMVMEYKPHRIDDPSTYIVAISQVVISYHADKMCAEETANYIYKNINKWRAQLHERVCLFQSGSICANKNTDELFSGNNTGTGIDIHYADNYKRINNQHIVVNLDISFPDRKGAMTKTEIQEIMKSIDIKKNLKQECRMFLNAELQRLKGNNRYAIMEATTAVELCISGVIKESCDKLQIDGDGMVTTFFRSLGDKFKALRLLGIDWATEDPQKEIVSVRNALFHNKMLLPTSDECKKVLLCIKKYLDLYLKVYYE